MPSLCPCEPGTAWRNSVAAWPHPRVAMWPWGVPFSPRLQVPLCKFRADVGSLGPPAFQFGSWRIAGFSIGHGRSCSVGTWGQDGAGSPEKWGACLCEGAAQHRVSTSLGPGGKVALGPDHCTGAWAFPWPRALQPDCSSLSFPWGCLARLQRMGREGTEPCCRG